MNDYLEIAFLGKSHETKVNLDFFAIKSAEKDFSSRYDGYVGIGPGEKSLMDQMKDKGYIDHRVIAFYTDVDTQDSSIKFGSWDEEGLKEGSNLDLINTSSQTAWTVSLSDAMLAEQKI